MYKLDLSKLIYIKYRLRKWREARGISIKNQEGAFWNNIVEEVLEYDRATTPTEKINAVCDYVVLCINAGVNTASYNSALNVLYNMGYDPYKCLLETIKEIHSRRGCWDPSRNKWIKLEAINTLEEAYTKAKQDSRWDETLVLKKMAEQQRQFVFVFTKPDGKRLTIKVPKNYVPNYEKARL